QLGIGEQRRWGFEVENRIDRSLLTPRKSRMARGHLVHNRPKAEQIAARVRLLSAQLLGRKVRHRPHHSSRLRQDRPASIRGGGAGGGGASACPIRHGHHSRQAKVEYFRLAALSDENIPRLNIPMSNSLLMSRLQPIGNLNRELNYASRRKSSPGNT